MGSLGLLKVCLWAAGLIGGVCAIGAPLTMKFATSDNRNSGGADTQSVEDLQELSQEENKEKWNEEDLQKLVSLTLTSLNNSSEDNAAPKEVEINSEGGAWKIKNYADTLDVESSFGDEIRSSLKSAFEYVLDEWTKNKWASQWSSNYWGTSWRDGTTKDVTMTGVDSSNLKTILLKVQLNNVSDNYIVGKYKVEKQSEKNRGTLELGIQTCTQQYGTKCEINKTHSITPKLKLRFS